MHHAGLVCIDFDGVICNSLNECMLTAYNAYFSRNLTDISMLPASYRELFTKTRYLVRDPGEYFVLLDAYYRGSFLTLEDFTRLIEDQSRLLKRFKIKFFEARGLLRLIDQRKWLELHPCYKQVVDFLLATNVPVVVVTTKDEESVKLLLKEYGLLERVLSVFGQNTLQRLGGKREAIIEACSVVGSNLNDTVFIDDHPMHLKEVQSCGVNLYYADWGFTPSEVAQEELPQGIRTLTLDHLSNLFKLN